MATWLIMVLFSVGAVVLFAVGLSLTLIFKGHHIDSEIASNRNMRARGISCPAADARGEAARSGRGAGALCGEDATCGDGSCASCSK